MEEGKKKKVAALILLLAVVLMAGLVYYLVSDDSNSTTAAASGFGGSSPNNTSSPANTTAPDATTTEPNDTTVPDYTEPPLLGDKVRITGTATMGGITLTDEQKGWDTTFDRISSSMFEMNGKQIKWNVESQLWNLNVRDYGGVGYITQGGQLIFFRKTGGLAVCSTCTILGLPPRPQ